MTQHRLYVDEVPDYSSPTFPPARDFQITTHEALREGRRNGHRCQLIMAPTGGGKTYLGLNIIQQTLRKGRRAVFMADRTTLINQTSKTADRYGLTAHGIIQAQNPRNDPRYPFQIASAQTIARRGWPEADVIIIDECFPPDVEVLTEKGFIRFDRLPRDIRCAQFEGGMVSFVMPTDYIDKPYDGELVRLQSQKGVDLAMTPGHELYLLRKGNVKKIAVSKASFNALNDMVAAGLATAESAPELTPTERLMIAHQADGSLHHEWSTEALFSLSFSFTKQRKIDRFEGILRDGGWNAARSGACGKRRFILSRVEFGSKRLSDHFDLAAMSSAKARAIIDEMVEWDGYKHSDTSWYYSSVVKENADFYQAVATLAGCRSNMIVQSDARSEKFGDVYRLFVRVDNARVATQCIKKTITHHKGRVYCIRVPSGNIIVRRNGKPLVIGNCHTQLSVWTEHIQKTSATVIGLSATPFSKGLGKLFTNLINAATMNELTKSGVLVPMRVFSCTQADMLGAAISGGEWTDGAAAERGMAIVGDVVAEWVKYGENRKTICFGATIEHCEELCAQFVKAGIMAALFTSRTTDEERLDLLKEYEKPNSRLKILISVSALSKGFDIADVGCVIDCRPLRKSLSEAIQMWGRGLRSHPGKSDLILLDHSGNILRFAESYTEVFFNGLSSLDSGEKLDSEVRKEPSEDEKPQMKCPSCGFKPFARRCMSCGFETQSADKTAHEPGRMQQITLGKGKVIDKQALYHECVAYAKANSAPEKQRGRAAHLFKDMVGDWPPYSFGSTPNVPVSKEVMSKIISMNIRRAKTRMRPGAEA